MLFLYCHLYKQRYKNIHAQNICSSKHYMKVGFEVWKLLKCGRKYGRNFDMFFQPWQNMNDDIFICQMQQRQMNALKYHMTNFDETIYY